VKKCLWHLLLLLESRGLTRNPRSRCWPGAALDCAGEVVAGTVTGDAVLDPQRAVADGGDGLQLVVPLVCGSSRPQSDMEWNLKGPTSANTPRCTPAMAAGAGLFDNGVFGREVETSWGL
jgi:hypothetical protein